MLHLHHTTLNQCHFLWSSCLDTSSFLVGIKCSFLVSCLSLMFQLSPVGIKPLRGKRIIARLTHLDQTSMRCKKWFRNSQMKLDVVHVNTCVWSLLKLMWTLETILSYFYRPQQSCGQGNVFTGVCLSTGGRVSASVQCWDARPPLDQADSPPDQADPPDQAGTPLKPGRPPCPPDQADTPLWTRQTPLGSKLQHTVYERPVRILLECILVLIQNTFLIDTDCLMIF